MKILRSVSGRIILMVLSTIMLAQLHAAGDKQIPAKGLTQEQVKQQFGEPKSVGATVGKPPITRWDYESYTVVFEGNYVIHSFLHKKLKAIHLNPKPEAAKTMKPAESESTTEALPEIEEINVDASEENTEAKVEEETVVEEISASESVEEVTEAEAPAEDAIVEEVASPNADQETEAKDLNYEEAPQDAEFGKWGY